MRIWALPNELLHSIIEYVAYTPGFPDYSASLFKRASPELVALSVAACRLRRVCMPFIFANIELRHLTDVENLEKDLELLSRFTKVLVLDNFHAGVHDERTRADEILVRILPQLRQLFYVELLADCQDRTVLFRAILGHPNVTSVLVHQLPGESLCDTDLSKVMLERQYSIRTFSSQCEKYFNRGMRLLCLELRNFDLQDHNQYRSQNFPSGLIKIQLSQPLEGMTSSLYLALSILLSTHATLNELQLLFDPGYYLTHDTPRFISSFIEEFRRQDLQRAFRMEQVSFCRTEGESSQNWYIMGLTLKMLENVDTLEMFKIVASSFPRLRRLTLRFDYHKSRHTYRVSDLATALAQFSSLRILSIYEVLERLDFGSNIFLPPVRQVDSTDALDALLARAETGLLWYASLVAKEAKSLESIFICDRVRASRFEGFGKNCYFRGWLHVVNANRDVGGILERTGYKRRQEISLETRLLPLLNVGSSLVSYH
ncbi:hypothetical protein FB446DRAFT_757666 [Lentinula raphanica]|nr:hypothetical protein FB446DRAFT_757666 [Lentinula raphanica]